MLHLRGIADRSHAVHHIRCVLIKRVVHRRRRISTPTHVVHTQTASDIKVSQFRSEFTELYKGVRQLGDCRFDGPDVLVLRSRVAMDQVETIHHAVLSERFDSTEQLGDGHPELALGSS